MVFAWLEKVTSRFQKYEIVANVVRKSSADTLGIFTAVLTDGTTSPRDSLVDEVAIPDASSRPDDPWDARRSGNPWVGLDSGV